MRRVGYRLKSEGRKVSTARLTFPEDRKFERQGLAADKEAFIGSLGATFLRATLTLSIERGKKGDRRKGSRGGMEKRRKGRGGMNVRRKRRKGSRSEMEKRTKGREGMTVRRRKRRRKRKKEREQKREEEEG